MTQKQIRQFLAALAGLGVICFLRFFDHSLQFHSAPMGCLQRYGVMLFLTTAACLALQLYLRVLLAQVPESLALTACFLSAGICLLLFSYVWEAGYFGAMDVCAQIPVLTALMLRRHKGVRILCLPLSFAATLLSPMSVVTWGWVLVMLLVHDSVVEEKSSLLDQPPGQPSTPSLPAGKDDPPKEKAHAVGSRFRWLLFAGCVLAMTAAVGLSVLLGYFSLDVVRGLSLPKALMSLLILFPCGFAFGCLIRRYATASESSACRRFACFLGTGALFPLLVWFTAGDYTRGLIWCLLYMLLTTSGMLGQDEAFDRAFDLTTARLKQYVPLPAALLLIPFLLVTFWMAGPLTVQEESILEMDVPGITVPAEE